MLKPKHLGSLLLWWVYFSYLITIIEMVLIIALPLLQKYLINCDLIIKISDFCWLYFSKQCHQMPSRSLFIFKHQMFVCNRCFFVMIGNILTISILLKKKYLKEFLKHKAVFLALIIPPLIVELILKIFFSYASNFFVRSINGLCQGAASYSIVFIVINFLNKKFSFTNILYLVNYYKEK